MGSAAGGGRRTDQLFPPSAVRGPRSLLRRRKRVGATRALRAEHESELLLGREVALGGSVGGAWLLQLQRAQHVLVEVAVLARHALSHASSKPPSLSRLLLPSPASRGPSWTNSPPGASPDL